MKFAKFSLFFRFSDFTILFLFFQTTLETSQSNLVISEFTSVDFTTYPGWTITPDVADACTNCLENRVFGGLNRFGNDLNVVVSKTYTWTIIAHYQIVLTFRLLKIDSWDSGEYVHVDLDGTRVDSIGYTPADGGWLTCGDANIVEKYLDRSFTRAHTSSSFEIKFTTAFVGIVDGYWGVREIYINLFLCDTSCATCSTAGSTSCTSCYTNAVLSSGTCTCKDNYYLKDVTLPCTSDPCSTCERCDMSCKTCNGGASTNCLSCEAEDTLSGSSCTYPSNAQIAAREFITSNFDETDTNNWTFSPALASGQRITTCGPYRIVGGFNKFGNGASASRSFTNLPAHYLARIRILFLKIDSWDGEVFTITADGTVILTSENFQPSLDTTLTGDLCGLSSQNYEAERYYSKTFSHSSSTLTISLTSNLNEAPDNESWGFSKFEMVVYTCDTSVSRCPGPACTSSTTCKTPYYYLVSSTPSCTEYILSIPNSATFDSCSDSTHWSTATSCESGFSGLMVDTDPGRWASAGEGVGAWIEVKLRGTFQISKFEFRNRLSSGERNSKLRISFDNSITKDWDLVDSYDIQVLRVTPPVAASTIRIYIITVYSAINNGGSFNVYGVIGQLNSCERCDISCKTCSGGASTNCLSCETEDTLSGGSCTYPANSQIVAREFVTSNFDETDTNNWTFSPGLASGQRITTCGPYRIVGGFNKFANGASASRSFTNLPSHYLARLRIFFLKIDSWDGEVFTITADGTVILTSENFQTTTDSTPTGNICGMSIHNEADRIYSTTFSHSSSTLTISLTSNLNETPEWESWGFSRFELVVYSNSCDTSITTCSGPACTSSTSCSTPYYYFLLSSPVTSCTENILSNPSSAYFWSCSVSSQLTNCGTGLCGCEAGFSGLMVDTDAGRWAAAGQGVGTWIEVKLRGTFQITKLEYRNRLSTGERNSKLQVIFDNSITKDWDVPNIYDIQVFNLVPPVTASTIKFNVISVYSTINNGGSFNVYGFVGQINTCERCDISCKTCSGGASSNCLSCETGDSLSGGSCTYPANAQIVAREFVTSNFDETDTNNWTFNPALASGQRITTCGPYRIIGGYNKFGSGATATRAFTGLPSHYSARLRIFFLKIDSWEAEIFTIKADGIAIFTSEAFQPTTDTTPSGHVCGRMVSNNIVQNEAERTYSQTFSHSAATLTISLETNLDSTPDDESWGFSKFELVVYKCHSSCGTCSGSASNQCLTCITGYLSTNVCLTACLSPTWGVNTTMTCEASCPLTTQFGDVNNNRICTNCDATCATCSAASPSSCLTCSSPRYFYLGTCYTICPSGKWGNNGTRTCDNSCTNTNEYGDTADRICKTCDPSCLTCSYPGTSVSCLTCASPKFLSAGSCVTLCPSPNWGNNGTRLCEASCTNTNEYGDTTDRICKTCDLTCLTCSSPGTAASCLTCASPKFLSAGSCVTACPSPNWGNNSTRKCEATCTNTNEYGDVADNRICKTCNVNCATCVNLATSCTSCPTNMFLGSSICYTACPAPNWGDTISKTCVSVCPNPNEFGDISDNRICKTCDPNCATCVGTATTCTTCSTPKFLSNSMCVLQCPDPLWGIPSTNTCDCICENSNEFGDIADFRKCNTCNANCLTCNVTATNCTTCLPPLFLLLTESTPTIGSCVSDCGVGKFGEIVSNLCTNCSTQCYTCEGKYDHCTQCRPNYLLYDNTTAGGTNYNDCINSTYLLTPNPDYNNTGFYTPDTTAVMISGLAVAQLCVSPCVTCSRNDSCLTCSQGLYMYDSSIAMTCIACNMSGFSIKNSTCMKCPPTCYNCSDTNFCEKCLPGYYLEYSGANNRTTGVCKLCDLPDEYIDSKFGLPEGLGICLNHSECQIQHCTKCSNLYKECKSCGDGLFSHFNVDKGVDFCSPCEPNFYVKVDSVSGNRSCLLKLMVSADLSSSIDPYVYRLLFNETVQDYFKNYQQNFALEVKNKPNSDYACNITQDSKMKYLFFISCSFNWNVTADESLVLKLINIPEDSETLSYKILKREFSVLIETFISCPVGFSYNKELAVCEPPPDVVINLELRYSVDPLRYHLVLDKIITEDLEFLIKKSLRGRISNSSTDDGTPASFTVNKVDNFAFELVFNFSESIINRPVFYLEVKSDATYAKFAKTELSIALADYYFVSTEATKAFQQAGASSKSGGKTSENLMPINQIFIPGSMFALKGMVLIQSFQLLRFIQIDYPPNVQALFDDKLSTFMTDFEIEVDASDGILDGPFYKFKFSKYLLNNSGSYIVGGCVFLLLGIIGHFLFPPMRNKLGHIKVALLLINFVEETVVWNFFLNHFLSRYMILVFTAAAAFRFPTFNSIIGIINFVFALFCSGLLYGIPIIIFIKLRQMQKLRDRKIIPIKINSRIFSSESALPIIKRKSLRFEAPSPQKKEAIAIDEVPEVPVVTKEKGHPITNMILGGKDPSRKHHNKMEEDHSHIHVESDHLNMSTIRVSTTHDTNKDDDSSNEKEVQYFSQPRRNVLQDDVHMPVTFKKLPSVEIPRPESDSTGTDTDISFQNQELDQILKKFKAIHNDFKKDNWISHYFILFELTRQIATAFLILYGDQNPVMVALCIMLINGIFIIFLICVKPYKSFQTFVLTIVNEFFLFIICLGILGIGFLQSYINESGKKTTPQDLDIFLRIGWIVIYANISLIYFFLTTQVLNILFMVYQFINKILPKLKMCLALLRRK